MAEQQKLSKRREMNWLYVLFQLQVNSSAVFAIGYLISYGCLWKTVFFGIFLISLGTLGQFAGAHRLWAHASYKANTGLRLFLMLCQTLVGHGSIYEWVRWHRLHHKYIGTDLDPYNSKSGFFQAQFISLTMDLSPAQQEALKEIDVTDLENDKIVMFQKKWYNMLFFLLVALLPVNAPCEYWGEGILTSAMLIGWLRYALTLHATWLIHSAINIWDLKLDEKFPADTNLVFILTKTYWISYHYLSPWDYQVSEFGKYGTDCVTKFIRVCAALGYATDLKTINSRNVREAVSRSVNEKLPISQCLAEGMQVVEPNGVASKICCS
ncbi:acyl-CoA Delta-9 desaturase [Dendroctonus ponderosae]|uniref:Fatty acid desaturase domain-containing protein n=1 Tax=Dendroctonus ponderosae TaxID=77166 RepID=J3JTM2_DENPD|nr:acyl-CoA Delta-9 desaturase [Dendroctonus ponderosae]AEE61543.1 unknown [Dendroctonus ponderosae]ERL86465.1 hypothetical protein D910_03871 [Dendroctonus ponderosae]